MGALRKATAPAGRTGWVAGGGCAAGGGGPVFGNTATGLGVVATGVAVGAGDRVGAPASRVSDWTPPQPAMASTAIPMRM